MSGLLSSAQWLAIFLDCGMKQITAARWAPVFCNVIKPDTFSAGKKDIFDFVPTILHESAMLEKLQESGNYSAARIKQLGVASAPSSRWRSLVSRADSLANNEYKFFEAAYGGRMGNGPEGYGDGAKFAGAGPLGVTGRTNYQWLADRAGQDIDMMPELLQQPHFALEFCIDWWEGRVPDSILGDEVKVRRIVNGGDFGLAEVRILLTKFQLAWARTVKG